MTTTTAGSAGTTPGASADPRWRTRDILVTAVIGVVFGVAFVALNTAWGILAPASAVAPVGAFFIYGGWLVPAVLAPLIVRKPGAALFAELVAAGVSVLLGSPWGPDTVLSGFVQGAGAELVFAFTLYRNWSLPVLVVASIASAATAWVHDWAVYYVGFALDVQIVRGIVMAISAVVIVAFGSAALVRSLRRAGVLEGFPD
ncbi:MAG: ECF transporter S component [Chloroflexi bacterium]|nr:ECF transporter S component [Chloroflexota bacterium]